MPEERAVACPWCTSARTPSPKPRRDGRRTAGATPPCRSPRRPVALGQASAAPASVLANAVDLAKIPRHVDDRGCLRGAGRLRAVARRATRARRSSRSSTPSGAAGSSRTACASWSCPTRRTQLVEVDIRYEVGSREDPPGKAGLAHLVEHLMFQHAARRPETTPLMHFRSHDLATFINAYTNWDTTHYMTTARAEQPRRAAQDRGDAHVLRLPDDLRGGVPPRARGRPQRDPRRSRRAEGQILQLVDVVDLPEGPRVRAHDRRQRRAARRRSRSTTRASS